MFENVKFENVYHYKTYFRIYYNMKFIISRPKISCTMKFATLHKTAQQSEQRVAQ